MKKKVLLGLALTVALAVPFSVFAATSETPVAKKVRGWLGIDPTKLTDQQKAAVKTYGQKMAELEKEFINKMVSNGSITKEAGDAEIQRIDEALKNGEADSFLPGFGKGRGVHGGFGGKGGFGGLSLDTSKLTDPQKAELMAIYTKMATMQKEHFTKLAADGLLTKEQSEDAVKKVDETLKKLQANGLTGDKRFGLPGGGFMGGPGIGMRGMGMDSSKLTDQQKADLEDFSKKMNELRKEVVNKLASFGVITADQATSLIQKMDDMGKFQGEGGREPGMKMRGRWAPGK